MTTLSAATLLNVWEQGQGRTPAQRALLLLAAIVPGQPVTQLAQFAIGQRDAHLLTLREEVFGPHLVCLVACPKCDEKLELPLDVADIRMAVPDSSSLSRAETQGETADGVSATRVLSLNVEGYDVQFRLPNSLDLISIASSDRAMASRELLERCLMVVRHNGEDAAASLLPPRVVEAIGDRMAQADPQAGLQLRITCPACMYPWQATFDIAAFFWSELTTWAQRTIHEVHTLARAYGWREAEILTLSPWRRRIYLEMIGT